MGYTVEVESISLNPEQLRAVNHGRGPMLVVAGAGTGKTQVITHRIARLIEVKECKPEEILALTFTDKAAGEMLDRLDGLVGWQAYRVNVMTFHAFGSQILQRFGHHAGLPTSAEVIPEIGKALLIKQHLSTIKLNYYGNESNLIDFAQRMVAYIELLQNADISVEQYYQYVADMKPSEHHRLDIAEAHDHLKIYELYEELKQHHGLIDYNDQIILPLKLLAQRPNIVQRLRKQFQYVLVDEYQDTNGAQDALLRTLIEPGGNIFAVGDDDQAIYGFRGARLGNILGFAEHFQVKEPLVLVQNYRSTQAILDAAYRMIQHNNPERLEERLGIDKQLVGVGEGQSPTFEPYPDSRSESEAVASQIGSKVAQGQSPESIAVLATSHRPLRQLARVLARSNVPYRLVSTINIFEQREILQLWHLLAWIGMTADDETITNLLPGPFIEWDAGQVRQLVDAARHDLVGVEEAIGRRAKTDKRSEQLEKTLIQWRQWARESPGSYLIYRLVFESGLGSAWVKQAEDSPRMVRVFEDLQQWLSQMQQYEHLATDPSLAGYLATFPKPPEIEAKEAIGDDHGVSLLTIHAAKGLEFETVYLINATAEAWTDSNLSLSTQLPPELLQDQDELPPEHEWRRLMYVAMTRAKRELTISAPVLQAGGRGRRTNPILTEIFGAGLKTAVSTDLTPSNLSKSLQSLEKFAPPTLQLPSDRLPFETADGWLELSSTDIDQYDRCPYEFYLERVLKIRSPFGPQINFGSLLHGLFRDYYQTKLAGDQPTLDQLGKFLEERWTDRGYRTAEEAQLGRQLAEETLTNFFKREEGEHRVIRSSEEPFQLSIPEAKLKLRGRIDATFQLADGIEIRDFKTGRKRDPEKIAADAKKSLQLRTYALAIEEITGKPPAGVVLDYVVTGTAGEAELSATILKNHRQKLANITDLIRKKQFAPNPDPFHNCSSLRYWGIGDDDEA